MKKTLYSILALIFVILCIIYFAVSKGNNSYYAGGLLVNKGGENFGKDYK